MTDTNKTAAALPKLTKRHLAILQAFQNGNYNVTVKQTLDGFWTVVVKFDGHEEEQAMKTARGNTKVWRNIVGAIVFVQENCVLAKYVFIEVSGWKLCRVENTG